MYGTIVAALLIGAALLWVILAGIVGLSLRATFALLGGALWRFALWALIIGALIYSLPSIRDRLIFLSHLLG